MVMEIGDPNPSKMPGKWLTPPGQAPPPPDAEEAKDPAGSQTYKNRANGETATFHLSNSVAPNIDELRSSAESFSDTTDAMGRSVAYSYDELLAKGGLSKWTAETHYNHAIEYWGFTPDQAQQYAEDSRTVFAGAAQQMFAKGITLEVTGGGLSKVAGQISDYVHDQTKLGDVTDWIHEQGLQEALTITGIGIAALIGGSMLLNMGAPVETGAAAGEAAAIGSTVASEAAIANGVAAAEAAGTAMGAAANATILGEAAAVVGGGTAVAAASAAAKTAADVTDTEAWQAEADIASGASTASTVADQLTPEEEAWDAFTGAPSSEQFEQGQVETPGLGDAAQAAANAGAQAGQAAADVITEGSPITPATILDKIVDTWGTLPDTAKRALISAGIITAAGALTDDAEVKLNEAGGLIGIAPEIGDTIRQYLSEPTDPMGGSEYAPPSLGAPEVGELAGSDFQPGQIAKTEISPWDAPEYTPQGPTDVTSGYTPPTGFGAPQVGAMPESAYDPATGQVTIGDKPAFDANKFSQELDDLAFLSQAAETGDIKPFEQAQIGSLQESLAGQWTGLFQAATADLAAKEERQIQTLVENVTTDWGGQFQKGISSLVARGLSAPGTSTTSDRAVANWVGIRDKAIVQGIRDIQNANSDRRLQLAMYGMETMTDLGKFDITTQLEQAGIGLQARGQDITIRGQDITAGESAADRMANLKMFGISSKMDLAKAKTAFEFEAMGMDADVALANAGRLQTWAIAQQQLGATARGQDINIAQMVLSGEITAAELQQNWEQIQSSQAFQAGESAAGRSQDWAQFQASQGLAARGQDIDLAGMAQQLGISEAQLAQQWAQFQGSQELAARGQDIDIAGMTQRGDIAEAGFAQDWARFGITTEEQARQHQIDTATTLRGQDVNASLALAIANMEKESADTANLWDLGGNLLDWTLSSGTEKKRGGSEGTANQNFDWSNYVTPGT